MENRSKCDLWVSLKAMRPPKYYYFWLFEYFHYDYFMLCTLRRGIISKFTHIYLLCFNNVYNSKFVSVSSLLLLAHMIKLDKRVDACDIYYIAIYLLDLNQAMIFFLCFLFFHSWFFLFNIVLIYCFVFGSLRREPYVCFRVFLILHEISHLDSVAHHCCSNGLFTPL